LPTPARYKNEKKSKEWKVKFERQDIDLGTWTKF
jgi:hypothetical protein